MQEEENEENNEDQPKEIFIGTKRDLKEGEIL